MGYLKLSDKPIGTIISHPQMGKWEIIKRELYAIEIKLIENKGYSVKAGYIMDISPDKYFPCYGFPDSWQIKIKKKLLVRDLLT